MISVPSKITASLVAGGAALWLAVLTPVTSLAAPTFGACSPSRLIFSASVLDGSHTTSENFANIPEASVGFTQGGASASCVIVRFSAETFVAGGNSVQVRAFIVNTTAAIPSEVSYSANDGGTSAHSFEFIFPSVAPGSHVLSMQFRTNFGGNAFVHRHNTVIQFK